MGNSSRHSKPMRCFSGSLNLEEQLDPGQPSPPLDSLNFDLAFRPNSPSVSRRVLLNFLSILLYLNYGLLEKTSVEARPQLFKRCKLRAIGKESDFIPIALAWLP